MIWLADTNYRIGLDNDTVRSLATSDQLDALLAADQVCSILVWICSLLLIVSALQLKQAMDAQQAFHGYEEGPILFRPTYRYNLGTDTYDTSEKMRIPAWTGEQGLVMVMPSQIEIMGTSRQTVSYTVVQG